MGIVVLGAVFVDVKGLLFFSILTFIIPFHF